MLLGVVVAAFATSLVPAAGARASTRQESILQDDPQLLGAKSPAALDARLGYLRQLGVDRVRVSIFWFTIAPHPNSKRVPRFRAGGEADPAAYAYARWQRFDQIAKLAQLNGLQVLFNVTGPAPAWASRTRAHHLSVIRPSAAHFARFVKAVGRRYSGSYPDPAVPKPAPVSPQQQPGLIVAPGTETSLDRKAAASLTALPRVDAWSLWNEPNYPSWLLPVWLPTHTRDPARMVPASPRIYRGLVDGAYKGLAGSGHGGDRILLGETSPRGEKNPRRLRKAIRPLEFVREVYCLNARYRPYRGRAARLRGCPATGRARRGFKRRHPGLFKARGWGHHPYSIERQRWRSPAWKNPSHDNAPMGNIGALVRAVNRSSRRWGGRGRMQVWITEYGYQTHPQDPYTGVSVRRQASWMSWGEQVAFRNPGVASTAQFLLIDDGPDRRYHTRRRWRTWQSGLYTHRRKPKPALREYAYPIHVSRRGRRERVFGMFRPAAYAVRLKARIQRRQGGRWRTVKRLTVGNPRGYLFTSIPGARGAVRIVWTRPGDGSQVPTRAAGVR